MSLIMSLLLLKTLAIDFKNASVNKPVLIILITSSPPTRNTNFSNANAIILLYIQLF